jgi:Caspase domain
MKHFAQLLAASALSLFALSTVALAEPLVFHASVSGKPTLDEGEGGGNPFASSLIEILGRPVFKFSELGTELEILTLIKSKGFQTADVPRISPEHSWHLVPAAKGELRRALVLVYSDYQKSGGAQSLPGAKHDAERVAAAFKKAGFVTEIAIDQDLTTTQLTLSAFARQSADDDVAVIYATGHGVEVDGTVYLLPGDYPVQSRNSALNDRGLRLSSIAASVRARRASVVFYGGCRDNPFGT